MSARRPLAAGALATSTCNLNISLNPTCIYRRFLSGFRSRNKKGIRWGREPEGRNGIKEWKLTASTPRRSTGNRTLCVYGWLKLESRRPSDLWLYISAQTTHCCARQFDKRNVRSRWRRLIMEDDYGRSWNGARREQVGLQFVRIYFETQVFARNACFTSGLVRCICDEIVYNQFNPTLHTCVYICVYMCTYITRSLEFRPVADFLRC